MKIVLDGTPLELKEFLGMVKPGMFNVSFSGLDIGNKSDETVIIGSKDYSSLINSLPDLPGINKDSFQYDPERDTGYFGRISSSEFIGYKELYELVGFNKGIPMKEDKGWLVFYFKGEILYIPQHPIRYDISWDDINEVGLVYGDKVIDLDGDEYNVSLMTGGKSDPFNDTEYSDANTEEEQKLDLGNGSMWNELMYRVHQDVPGVTDEGETGSGGPQYGENWDNLSDEDLNINWRKCEVGTATWTQETSVYDTSYRVYRGDGRLAYLSRISSSNAHTSLGWRPVLCLSNSRRQERI